MPGQGVVAVVAKHLLLHPRVVGAAAVLLQAGMKRFALVVFIYTELLFSPE